MERVRSMLLDSELPHFLWVEALMHAAWLKRRSGTHPKDGKTPYELATGKIPDLTGLPIWGSRVWVKNLEADKLSSRAEEG